MIYITGDSFCHYRSPRHNDWPAVLAQQLNLNLAGVSFPGCGWWPAREPLLKHLEEHGSDTKLFVFCHTDCHRPLSNHKVLYSINDKEMVSAWETYYRHFNNEQIDYWVIEKWYLELNDVLAGYDVIHLQCFMTTNQFFPVLNGCRIATSLSERSLEFGDWGNGLVEDPRRNHFSEDQNIWLAEQILKCYRDWVNNNRPDKNYYLE